MRVAARASCRRTSTAPPAPRARCSAPDTSTSQPGDARRHDRQQLLGQPLDRLRHDGRPRARARGRARRRLAAPTLSASVASRRTRRSTARSTAGCRGSLRDHARAIAARLPEALAPVRRLPARPARDARSTSRKLVVGSEGTLVVVTEADGRAGRAAEGEDVRRRALRLDRRARSPPPTTRSRSTRPRSR